MKTKATTCLALRSRVRKRDTRSCVKSTWPQREIPAFATMWLKLGVHPCRSKESRYLKTITTWSDQEKEYKIHVRVESRMVLIRDWVSRG